jgi:hypothetical protein
LRWPSSFIRWTIVDHLSRLRTAAKGVGDPSTAQHVAKSCGDALGNFGKGLDAVPRSDVADREPGEEPGREGGWCD